MRSCTSLRVASALLLALGCQSCTLSADLDSLTEGNGVSATIDAGADSRSPQPSSDIERTCTIPSCSMPAPPDANETIQPGHDSTLQPADSTPLQGDAATPSAPQPTHVGHYESTDIVSSTTPSTRTSREPEASSGPTDNSSTEASAAAAVVHRYTFTDVTTSIEDGVGDADGAVVGVPNGEDGSFVFDGETYIELPTAVLDNREDITVEAWFTSYATRSWERIFDAGEQANEVGRSYLFFTPRTPSESDAMRVTFRADGGSEVSIDSAAPTADNQVTHIAVVFDGPRRQLRLYHDGELSGTATTEESLQAVNIEHVWLGRSLFDNDPRFEGELHELRIYDGALNDVDVRASFNAGPDTLAR